MKSTNIRIVITTLLISILIYGCTSSITEQPASTPTEVPQETERPDPAPRFTIQADEALRDPVTALYEAYFTGESPTFVDSEGNVLATAAPQQLDERPILPATFLPDSVLIPLSESSEIEDFIDFSISADGQQVLIDAEHLPQTITLTDQVGNTVEINQPVRRVISSYGPATAFIYSVDAEDRMVSASYLGARDPLGAAVMAKIDPRFPDIMGDDFFTQRDFNLEEAATLNPDLIISSARSAWLDSIEQLGIPVFLFDTETPERLREAMLLMGQLFGPHAAAQGRAWVAYFDQIVEELEARTAEISLEERVRVLFSGTSPLRVASGEMYQTFIIEASGGVSVTSELAGYWNDVNLEQILIWDPEVVIVPPYGGATVEAITESAEWQILEAVEEGRVYQMPKLVVPWDTPAPDSVLGLIWMGKLLYPEQVNLDCALEAEYFYNTFYDYEIPVEEIALICPID